VLLLQRPRLTFHRGLPVKPAAAAVQAHGSVGPARWAGAGQLLPGLWELQVRESLRPAWGMGSPAPLASQHTSRAAAAMLPGCTHAIDAGCLGCETQLA
jgi:hypothetical protein